jgi:hypothetical protein
VEEIVNQKAFDTEMDEDKAENFRPSKFFDFAIL